MPVFRINEKEISFPHPTLAREDVSAEEQGFSPWKYCLKNV